MNEIDELYRYYKFLFGYVYSLCRNRELTEDIVQDTFVKAITHAGSFRGECKIEVWLCRISRNLYYSWLRKKDSQTLEDNMERADERDFVLKLENRESAKQIIKVLHELPEPYKEVFSLHVFGEIPLADIAELFGKSVSRAGVTFHRSKQKIREKLKEDGYE